jgi:hypothetical protein
MEAQLVKFDFIVLSEKVNLHVWSGATVGPEKWEKMKGKVYFLLCGSLW